MKYLLTYRLKKKGVRRVAMRNGKISTFKTKKSALRRAKEYEGYFPRPMKVKWM